MEEIDLRSTGCTLDRKLDLTQIDLHEKGPPLMSVNAPVFVPRVRMIILIIRMIIT